MAESGHPSRRQRKPACYLWFRWPPNRVMLPPLHLGGSESASMMPIRLYTDARPSAGVLATALRYLPSGVSPSWTGWSKQLASHAMLRAKRGPEERSPPSYPCAGVARQLIEHSHFANTA